MNERIGIVETLVREVLRRLDSDVTPRHTDHEQRLRALETSNTEQRTTFRVWLAVVGASAAGGGGAIGTLASWVMGR